MSSEDARGDDGASLGRLDDDGAELLRHRDDPVAQEVGAAQRDEGPRSGDPEEHPCGSGDRQALEHPTTVTRMSWRRWSQTAAVTAWSAADRLSTSRSGSVTAAGSMVIPRYAVPS